MNRLSVALAATVLAVAAIGWSPATSAVAPSAEMGVGRYSLIRGADDIALYCIDTATGQVYSQAKGSSEWRRCGGPAPTAK